MEAVKDMDGLPFSHGDEMALDDLIRQLHDDHELYNHVADACYKRARQFDINNMVEKYNEVYNRII